MTDTELLKIKALSFIRPAGRRRPKENHYNGITDYYAKNNKRKQPSLFKRNMVENEDQCGKKKRRNNPDAVSALSLVSPVQEEECGLEHRDSRFLVFWMI